MQRYFLYITGCDMNHSDAERVASVFNSHGFSLTGQESEADVIIAFACSVREKAVHKILGLGNKWGKMRPKPKAVLTGCILDQDKKKFEEKFDLVFGIKEIELLNCYIATLLKNQSGENNNVTIQQCNNVDNLETQTDYLNITPHYQSNYSVNIPIMTGCDNFCSYCAVPYTRGREVSRSEDDVLQEVETLISAGYKEITLLGQNVNSYSKNNENNSEFVNLLKKIDQLEGNHWLRFYANHPKDFSDELIQFLKNSKHFCHYIHLPLQSGDDEILRKMNRHYTVKQYLEIINKIRVEIPDCALTTDIIVGFPGESEEQFENTVKLLEKVGFDMIFISEYSPRSGTPAAKMVDDISHGEKEKRKRYLNDVVLAGSVLKNNKKLLNKKGKVLVYKQDKKGNFVGKTAGLKDVRFAGKNIEIGEFVEVKITKANGWGLEGEVKVESF